MQVFGYGKSERHWVSNPPQIANLPPTNSVGDSPRRGGRI
jgi:hypothetical protein